MNTFRGSIDQLLDLRRADGSAESDADQEGWMVSYADLITLLFIFFAVMLSISAVSKAKFELLSRQFNQASSTTSLTELKSKLDAEIAKQSLGAQVNTQIGDDGLQVQFNESVLFGSGQATLNPEGARIMARFAQVLSGMGEGFRLAIEGHTDDRPIHTEAFASNWSLSAGRAVNVLHFLAANGLNEKKMMVRAYADTRPANQAPAEAAGKAQNRRVTLLVF